MNKIIGFSTDSQNTIKLDSLLDDITNFIIENSNFIVEANKKDIEFHKKQIKIKELLNIVEQFRNNNDFPIVHSGKEKRAIFYYGEPYLTLNLSIQAIISNSPIYMCFSNFMNNVNNSIIETIKKVTKKYELNDLIYSSNECYVLKDNNNINSFLEREKIDNIIVIGDSTAYQLLKPKYNVTYYPYNNIILYSNNDKFEKLKEAIFSYANENSYEVEITYEDSIEEFANYINQNKLSNIAVLLTENEEDKQKAKSLLIDKKLFINENPFKNEFQTGCNYLN